MSLLHEILKESEEREVADLEADQAEYSDDQTDTETVDGDDTEGDENNSPDVIKMDTVFLIRIMELARESIEDDATLHRVADVLVKQSIDGHILSMDDYDEVEQVEGLVSHEDEPEDQLEDEDLPDPDEADEQEPTPLEGHMENN